MDFLKYYWLLTFSLCNQIQAQNPFDQIQYDSVIEPCTMSLRVQGIEISNIASEVIIVGLIRD